ncbi:ABC transporter ATP-binding protein [Agrobacterium larrymoorei]|uniref:sn-glycerol-3-phosphate ABC transporter ATP-binding protein UgpC n=1 Tax=Agrobacterium larrymoorei TaxID=160699 RepID=A0A4D7E0L9_9HYPH|nr:sn-glycerol-3-phosphate ABC transporter ATP-binding protein UgpC [Agrobacterium larrymoorei]QCI99816.1 sn-glycerol-3-phosphate ABC transporter ATP-binding protein UgpC [Agrobacterium larrymoorei]QYA09748.1 sn-glycerol-3-phosphate ABC transporter ATP-binding protein UgpC [Agrobacterium larrymoorei]
MAGLSLKNVVKNYGALEVIHRADLEIKDGEFVVFVGPSGCGKSTLLRMIAGLEDISGGEISIGGNVVNDAEPADRGIAMVFQSYALYPHMTVEDNLSFGLRMNGNPKADTEGRVRRAAEILQINELMKRRPKQLSGGQRQRVAIGRAIVREPQVFLFDEPLSNLDAELRVQMRVEISKLHKQLGTTMIYVTHDQTEAMTLADKIVVLRAGNIEQVGAPLDLYDDPENRFVAGFVGSPKMNFLPGKVMSEGAEGVTVTLDHAPSFSLTLPISARPGQGSSVTLGIRPEHFTDAGNGAADLTVEVDVAEHLGNTSYVYAHLASDLPLIVERPESRHVGKLDRLTVSVPANKAFLFDSDGKRLR